MSRLTTVKTMVTCSSLISLFSRLTSPCPPNNRCSRSSNAMLLSSS
ncbi:unnamed protein product [Staurois parvus]|uniref:Uncharacterized protein n=1 Tax=Staurois parvus TaxID=386267 RepID=A0ABN9CAG9_9NEOB|nr:unnamed protein product [Staurois parvus]